MKANQSASASVRPLGGDKGRKAPKKRISTEVFSSVMTSTFVRFFVLVTLAIMMVIFQPPSAHPVLYVTVIVLPIILMMKYGKELIFEFFVMVHIIESSLGVFEWYNAVDDNLVLGAIPLMEKQADELVRMNISLIISVVEPFELSTPVLLGEPVSTDYWKKVGIEQRVLSCPDFFPPPLDILEEGAKLLDTYLTEGKRVYIHCKSGKGRSASVVMAYFLKYRYTGMDLLEVYRKLYSRRGVIFGENSAQMEQMKRYQARIRSAPF